MITGLAAAPTGIALRDHVLKLPSIGRKTKAVSSPEKPYLEKIQSEKCVTKLLSRNS